MNSGNEKKCSEEIESAERQLRVDLAAAFRLAVHFDWHESVGNHFSAAVSNDGNRFLLNPKWQHFSTIKASDLLLLDANDGAVMEGENPPDATAWCIHGGMHSRVPHARVLLHCHPPYATALCGLKDPAIKPIDQNTARFYNRIAIDLGFSGLAEESEEGERIAAALGAHSIMMMGNHGIAVVADSVAEAFEDLFFLERASRTMILAYSTCQPLNVMEDGLAEKTAQGWEPYREAAFSHFDHLKQMLDSTDSTYRD